jgi:negative regulator of sigma E activity
MSRVTRIALAALVSLAVIVGIYTSVEGASLSARQDRAGSHQVSGAMVNLDHYRSAAPQPELAPMQSDSSGKGHGCDSENRTSPDD